MIYLHTMASLVTKSKLHLHTVIVMSYIIEKTCRDKFIMVKGIWSYMTLTINKISMTVPITPNLIDRSLSQGIHICKHYVNLIKSSKVILLAERQKEAKH